MRKSSAALPLLLGLLSAVGPVSTDMYLPAFPAIQQSLGGWPEITLATWFAGLAVGQITQGTLADRFGRRMPLLFGTTVYALASVGCALSPDIATLSAFRLLAAFGGSASMVVPRAIVRDLADGQAAARLLSRLMLIMGVAPILAPSLGGAVLQIGDWRAIFWICAAYGAVCGLIVWRTLPDTLPPNARVPMRLASLTERWRRILTERGFITHAGIGAFAMFGMFSFLAGAPAVFIGHFGFSPQRFPVLFGISAAGFVLASQINPLLLRRFPPGRILRASLALFLVASVILAVVALSGIGPWWAVGVPILVAMATQGVTMPNATVGALSRHAGHAGSASALMGTLQFCVASLGAFLVGALSDGTPRAMAVLMLFGAAAATYAGFEARRARERTMEAEPVTSGAASARVARPR